MKVYKMMKHTILSFAVMLVFGWIIAGGVDAKAAVTTVKETVEDRPYILSVGDEIAVYNAANLKINGKAPKKLKKKVKTIYSVTDSDYYYIPASYYDRAAYNTYTDYQNAQNGYKYISATDYYFSFQKPGTYTFKYYTYSTKTTRNKVEGKDYYSYDVTVTKKLNIKKYKVVKDTNILKSISLGNAKVTNKTTTTANQKTTGVYVRNQYLKGKSGKLKVALNSTYKITSIVVCTFDKDGKAVYTQAKNKGKVTYGLYPRDNSYTNENYPIYNSISKGLMKETIVYIGYRNKLTGEYTKHTVKKNNDGSTYVESEYKYYGNTQVYTSNGTGGNCVLTYTFYLQ